VEQFVLQRSQATNRPVGRLPPAHRRLM